ncbi:fatty acid desaturase [Yoonia sp. R2331]|uniref:fatty acid desaturase n=1 Tax=Yoonia sp. R2331 TaxID=3237238 RepID=UPI0034E5530F
MRDWPTLVLIVLCYSGWAAATVWLPEISVWLAVVVLAPLVALQSSLQHEVLHGHPFRSQRLNEGLVFLTLNLAIPYQRFRDTHLEHHRDAMLTDPYDDPETNYIDPVIWERMPKTLQGLMQFNNTLLGRMILGPLIGQIKFMHADWLLIRMGDKAVLRAWGLHAVASVVILAWLITVGTLPLWAYGLAAYGGLALLRIRTFLEHQAHESARGRTVVIEDRGLLALLFLNNNYHVVHHMHPQVSWFRLPALYRSNRDHYLRRNHAYYFASYWSVISRFLLRSKDPVAHPIWRGDQRKSPLPERITRRISARQ